MNASISLGGIPNKVQVSDMGVDGRNNPVSSSAMPQRKQDGELALQEINSFFIRSHKVIVALTVKEILDEHIAMKLS